jgi:hypothetical protein
MATIASAVNTVFTPAVGSFVAQCTGGQVRIDRRNTSGAAWTTVGFIDFGTSVIVDNPVSGCQYQFTTTSGTPVVQADQ